MTATIIKNKAADLKQNRPSTLPGKGGNQARMCARARSMG